MRNFLFKKDLSLTFLKNPFSVPNSLRGRSAYSSNSIPVRHLPLVTTQTKLSAVTVSSRSALLDMGCYCRRPIRSNIHLLPTARLANCSRRRGRHIRLLYCFPSPRDQRLGRRYSVLQRHHGRYNLRDTGRVRTLCPRFHARRTLRCTGSDNILFGDNVVRTLRRLKLYSTICNGLCDCLFN